MTHDFQLNLLLDPQSPLRVLGLLAQRQIVPQSVHCEKRGDRLHMAIEVVDIDIAMAQSLAEKLRQLIVVVESNHGCRAGALAT